MSTPKNLTNKINIDIMKSVMIVLDQSHYETVMDTLSALSIRGFTAWREVKGRGSENGIPHYGSHAWPSVNSAILTVVEDDKVDKLLDRLRDIDKETESLGLKAFVWNIEKMM